MLCRIEQIQPWLVVGWAVNRRHNYNFRPSSSPITGKPLAGRAKRFRIMCEQ